MAYFNTLFWHLLEALRKTTKTVGQNTQCSSWKSNPRF